MVHYWFVQRYISVWSYVTVWVQGPPSTAECSLTELREQRWKNDPLAELWRFLINDLFALHLEAGFNFNVMTHNSKIQSYKAFKEVI